MNVSDILNLVDIHYHNFFLSESDDQHREIKISNKWFVLEIHLKLRLSWLTKIPYFKSLVS